MTSKNENIQPLEIKDCALLNIATGSHAQNLEELRDQLESINLDSILNHFWTGKLRPTFQEQEYYNDFAIWASTKLHDNKLAERLSLVNPGNFTDIEDLRKKLIEIVDLSLKENKSNLNTKESEQFQFTSSELVLFKTKFKAARPEDLTYLIPRIPLGSIYFHFIQSKDEFVLWLSEFGNGYEELKQQIVGLDPYFFTLTEYHTRVSEVFDNFFQGEVK